MDEFISPTILLIMPHRFAECTIKIGRCLDIFLHIITFTRAMHGFAYLAPWYSSLLQGVRGSRGQVLIKQGTMIFVMSL
jgi:hypothetical protein